MERLTTLVSSRGILKSCAAFNENPLSSNSFIDPDIFENLKKFDSIYICSDAVDDFFKKWIKSINDPIVLVSGDSDFPITVDFLENNGILEFVESELISEWYAQNLKVEHPKIHPMPIGIDYHTMNSRPGFWGLLKKSPNSQEFSLFNVAEEAKLFNNRIPLIYNNWQFQLYSDDRLRCLAEIDRTICYFEEKPVPRHSCWLRQSEFMFVASPEGMGPDCHRTWEALALGCIPILRKPFSKKLFEDLPVMIVEEWSEISQKSLIDFANDSINKKFDYSKLMREVWMRKIRLQKPMPLPKMSMYEFKEFMVSKPS